MCCARLEIDPTGSALDERPQSTSDEQLSSVNSYALSTPTHTEFTEGIPSYTGSSPSLASDILGQPSLIICIDTRLQ